VKCIRFNDGKVDRLSNDAARRLVGLGLAIYVPKSNWKALRPSKVVPKKAPPPAEVAVKAPSSTKVPRGHQRAKDRRREERKGKK
jgi:hypothetical protein